MSMASPIARWRPPTDEELTWFKPGGQLPTRPTRLEYTFQVGAFAFGVSRALESLYFPLYEIRSRLIEGELYLAAVPSALAESDLDAQLGRMRDSGLRFTRGVRGSWERAIKREVEEYNDRMAGFAPAGASDHEVAEGLTALRRTRANQWFAATRAVFAPTVMLRRGIGETPVAEAEEVSREALEVIQQKGGDLLDEAVDRLGQRLVNNQRLEDTAHINLLELGEIREGLDPGHDYRPEILKRRSERVIFQARPAPEMVGPELPADAPRMYLLRDVIALIA